ncbi:PAQR family membrane homeostasis protein TrhA [Mesohalobacter halotolerans]|uniref:Hemolysin III family protein n=1 Tax=Mesohalobacter halotolerans TaxID=1883405 RepID=A0A4U5TQ85_9FLAO|nr:hemolysin III family protein [Mesohalobacter halotolerans]MBS3737975.1 hemolysin III family protein [Psychroflexus sp.]TKS56042.1 hemolysin III family protein [Mesohalobacter halotolerans]
MSAIQSKHEEFLNTFTHGLGIVLSFLGLLVLVSNYDEEKIDFLYVLIYGLSLILLYSASTIYHSVNHKAYKALLRKLDHISIYILISGTYTPICTSVLKDSYGLLILSIVWSLTLLGLILKLFFTGRFEKISLLLYLIMGWLIIIDIDVFYQNVEGITLWFLGLGGFFYTSGILFYVMHNLKYHHVIWHVFVLLGSFFHYLMVLQVIT